MIFNYKQNNHHYLFAFAVFLAVVAYVLPWVISRGAGLTFGAYDLAEWASLHPQVRAETPILLTSLLLRLPPVCLALIVAFSVPVPPSRSQWWWMGALFALIVTLALMPPLEFFIHARDDVNYQQQSILVTLTVIGSILGLSGFLSAFRRFIAIFTAVAGIGVSIAGLYQGYTLMRDFSLPVQIGIGSIGIILIFMVMALSILRADNRVT